MRDRQNLQALVGERALVAAFEPAPPPGIRARVAFAWMPGEQPLVEITYTKVA
jgi:hypothetical protein